LRSICGTENTSQQKSLQCLSTINIILSAGTAWSAASWPPVNSACVQQLFQQPINTMLPAFLRKFICEPLCCVPPNTNFLSYYCPHRWIPCWLLTNLNV